LTYGGGVFERYGDEARQVVSAATAEARRLGHGHIGTEHLLLGILHDQNTHAARCLVESGGSLGGGREMAAELVGNRDGPMGPSGELPFTERANRSLERAARLALRRRAPEVDPTHILISVVDVEGRAGQVLRGLGVDLSALRRCLDTPESATAAVVGGASAGGEAPADALPASEPSVEPAAPDVPAPRSAVPPACFNCGTELEWHLAHQTVAATGPDGTVVPFVVVYCGACGAALSALASPPA
jgi:hypothetical protein